MGISVQDVKQVVIDADDFGFEMRVRELFAKFINIGNDIQIDEFQHGATYDDPVTGKAREFDYRCKMSVANGYNEPLEKWHISLAVECKNLSEHSPLAICGRARVRDEAYYVVIDSLMDGPCMSYLRKGGFQLRSPYPIGEFVGKSFMRLKLNGKTGKWESEGQADLYDKWNQAMASSDALVREAFQFGQDRRYRKHSTIVIPIVVVPNERLWKVNYKDNGSMEDPVLVDDCLYFTDRKMKTFDSANREYVLTHLHFLTVDGLTMLLSKLKMNSGNWSNLFQHEMPYLYSREKPA